MSRKLWIGGSSPGRNQERNHPSAARFNRRSELSLVGFLAIVCWCHATFLSGTHAATVPWQCSRNKVYDCTSQIYCQGELLQTIQLNELFNDSKSFVDHSQVNDPKVTLENFEKLMNSTNRRPTLKQLETFVSQNFVANDELEKWTPPDWHDNPSILKRIKDPKYQIWAKELNAIWKTLARKIKTDVKLQPERHSIIYVENGFIIPGGRFKEFYYWDSYWVIKGLLLTGMKETVKGMIENFLSMVETFDFIPNGGRVYYLMRSQPPLLIPMVQKYYEATGDIGFVKKHLDTLDKEFAFWICQKSVDVEKNGNMYWMLRYIVDSDGPRPESYREDYKIGSKVPDSKRRILYEDLKAAAESGWDFSARWFITNENSTSLADASTRNIIPVDLNSFVERNARILANLHKLVGQPTKAKYYKTLSQKLRQSIANVLWDEKDGVWYDYDLLNKKHRKIFYPSNLTPLYTLSYNEAHCKEYGLKAVEYLKRENILDYWGGTPASLDRTGQQWDFPNAWPPLQSLIALGLLQTNYEPAVNTAKELALRWLRANYAGFEKSHAMFEKYDAVNPGKNGGGGEYEVQTGFGWTNGVVFEFLDIFPNATIVDSL